MAKRKSASKSEVMKQAVNFSEIGSTGLEHSAGEILEEKLHQLQKTKRHLQYKEMSENDSTVGALLYVIEALIRRVDWRTQEASKDPSAMAKKQFLDECISDMNLPWQEIVSQIMGSMLIHGYAPMEMVFKERNGGDFFLNLNKTGKPGSQFDDGRVGWHKFAIRSPETIDKWKIEDTGEVSALIQKAPPKFEEVIIPMEKILLFRTSTQKNNPEGKSILRNAFRSWFFKKKIENIEAIGVERDLAGLPMALVPPEIMKRDAGPDEKAIFEQIKRITINVRRDEQEGIVFPNVRDENGNPMYEFKLLTAGGSRQFKTNEIIQRYRQDIAMSVIADFILVGHEKTGSFSLNSSKTQLFTMALTSWMQMIADVLNRKAIPMLFWVNGEDMTDLPSFTFGDVETIDLTELGNFINALTSAGIDLTAPNVQEYLKGQANIPVSTDGDGI